MADRVLTPQQELYLTNYLDPKSPTFSNATRSAIEAGYTETYANNITNLLPDWLSENIGDRILVQKAERNISEFLDNGRDTIKADITKFVAERLNRKKYAAKQEIDITSNGLPLRASINILQPIIHGPSPELPTLPEAV